MSAAHTFARSLPGDTGKSAERPATGRSSAWTPSSTRLMVMIGALAAFAAATFNPHMLWDGDTL